MWPVIIPAIQLYGYYNYMAVITLSSTGMALQRANPRREGRESRSHRCGPVDGCVHHRKPRREQGGNAMERDPGLSRTPFSMLWRSPLPKRMRPWPRRGRRINLSGRNFATPHRTTQINPWSTLYRTIGACRAAFSLSGRVCAVDPMQLHRSRYPGMPWPPQHFSPVL